MRPTKRFTLLLVILFFGFCGLSGVSFLSMFNFESTGLSSIGVPDVFREIEGGPITVYDNQKELAVIDSNFPERIQIDLPAGQIQIHRSSDSSASFTLKTSVSASSRDEADKIFESLSFETDLSAEELVIEPRSGTHPQADGIWLEVEWPVGQKLFLEAESERLSIDGLDCDLELETGEGDLKLSHHVGSIIIRSEGDLELRDIRALGGGLRIDKGLGDLNLFSLRADTSIINSRAGDLDFSDLELQTLAIESELGDIKVDELDSESLAISARAGDIDLDDVILKERLDVVNEFGEIEVDDIRAQGMYFEGKGGQVDLTDADVADTLEIDVEFGDARLRRVLVGQLIYRSRNGNLDFAGILREDGNHKATNEFGDIRIDIPSGTRLALDLSTSFGEILGSSAFEIPTAASENGHFMDDHDGRSTGALEISTNGGNIKLRTLAESDYPATHPDVDDLEHSHSDQDHGDSDE